MKKYLKIAFTEWNNESRDKRELTTANELGYTTRVIAITKKEKKTFLENISGFEVLHVPTRKYGNGLINVLFGRIYAIIEFVKLTRIEQADIISGHDYTGLLIGYIANRFRKRGERAKLIYDSHEFELYRKKRSIFSFLLVRIVEGFLIKRADANMMVSDGIADEVQDIYRLKERPIVVRNTPSYSRLDKNIVQEIRKTYFSHLNISKNGKVVIYHGNVVRTRRIELVITAIASMDNVGMVILGEVRDSHYLEFLKDLIQDIGLERRIYFHPVVPIEELCNYIAAADAGVIFSSKCLRNLYYALPNKFFENVQAMTPMVTSDLPEMGRLIKEYGIGLLADDDKPEEINLAIHKMLEDEVLYERFKKNIVKAKQDLCWENEKIKVIDMIKKLEG